MTQTDPRDGSWAVNQSYRNPDFDGLRALSIVFVLLLHATYGRLHGGFLGVDIFFVLSGYLITTLLVNEMRRTGTISLTAFYVRRAYRILPVLFITVALGMIVAPSQSPQQEHWLLVSLTAIFFVANFLPADVMGNLGHTWSLAVEEQFYLIWPAVLLFSSKANRYAPLALAVCISLLAVWIRHEMIVHPTSISIYTFSLARMDSIMMGCLVALANATWAGGGGRGAGRFWHVYIAVSWVVLAILFTSMEREFMETHAWAFTAFASGVAILLLALGRADRRSVFIRWLSGRTVQWIGLRSYGLYLYHYPVFFFFEPLRVSGDLVNYVIVTGLKLIATFSIAEISWRYVELPLLTVKNRSMYASRKEGIMVSDRDSQRK